MGASRVDRRRCYVKWSIGGISAAASRRNETVIEDCSGAVLQHGAIKTRPSSTDPTKSLYSGAVQLELKQKNLWMTLVYTETQETSSRVETSRMRQQGWSSDSW
jgi:hypothetical protein